MTPLHDRGFTEAWFHNFASWACTFPFILCGLSPICVLPQRCGKALYLGGVRANANDLLSGFLDSASDFLKPLARRLGMLLRGLGWGAMAADALSDVLKTIRLTGAAFFDVIATAPWVAEQLPAATILPKVLYGARHLIAYHVVTEGRCFANIIGEEPFVVEAGEVVVFTRGDPHVMASHPGMRAEPITGEGPFARRLPPRNCRS